MEDGEGFPAGMRIASFQQPLYRFIQWQGELELERPGGGYCYMSGIENANTKLTGL